MVETPALVQNRSGSNFAAWVAQTIPRSIYARFRVAFAALWLIYDVLDLVLAGNLTYLWGGVTPALHATWVSLQVGLIVCELGLLVGRWPRLLALLVCALRGYQASLFELNDFFYYCVVALLLTQCDSRGRPQASNNTPVPAWPRDVFIVQTAWIYVATALLKLSPDFLSGGDLYVRQNYTAKILGWYPEFYQRLISNLSVNAVLAWGAIICELALATTLLSWCARKKSRHWLRFIAAILVSGIHLFAAATVNVFFFGASMILQVLCLTASDAGQEKNCNASAPAEPLA